jgi:hypothetical protein
LDAGKATDAPGLKIDNEDDDEGTIRGD